MILTSRLRGLHLEPPPWLYARLARGSFMRLIYRRFVVDLAGSLPPGARVLDVGAGPGYLLSQLARERPDLSLYGLDCAYDMIRRARARPKATPLRWLVADACRLPFPDGIFGQVIATFTFHIWPCPVTGLQELRRILTPGGQAWVYELRRKASPRDLQAFARETGLPYCLVFLGYNLVRWQHALDGSEFELFLRQAAGSHSVLEPAHHLFWRAEVQQG
jgi:ubiquinone/menaquinone biosynthesis C-methylase UbiE